MNYQLKHPELRNHKLYDYESQMQIDLLNLKQDKNYKIICNLTKEIEFLNEEIEKLKNSRPNNDTFHDFMYG